MNTTPHRRRRAFTLIELLVVITIIGILITLSIPSYHRITASMDMTRAGQLLIAELDNARLAALAHNRPVELRLCQLPDPSGVGAPSFRAIQSFLTGDDGALTPIAKPSLLPDSVTLSADPAQSPLLAADLKTPGPADPEIPPYGRDYRYAALHFRPNGQLDPKPGIPAASWYLTLCRRNPGTVDPQRPGNFITISLNPANGRTSVYRP